MGSTLHWAAGDAADRLRAGAEPAVHRSTDWPFSFHLEGRRVGAQSGTTGEGEVEALIDEGVVAEDDYRQYDNYTLAVQDLENGNVDAIVIDIPVARNFAEDRAVEVAFVIETGEQFGFGMRQDDDRLSDVNDALAEIQDDGTYEDLVSEWFE